MSADGPEQSGAAIPISPWLDKGGDPACWSHLVCPECGLLSDAERPIRGQACGTSFTDS